MKKVFLLTAGLCVIALMSTSCLKTRYCNCKSESDPAQNYKYTYENISNKDAKDQCENQQSSGRIYTADYTCELE
ncbi:MAG TPA: hypothetical protein PKN48_02235 [Bacteroidales bacterium]|nr:hypothetical protein [Bacteroidales bacterium]